VTFIKDTSPNGHFQRYELDLCVADMMCLRVITSKNYCYLYYKQGHEKRRTVYNLYHILNHDVLFGGFYLNQVSRRVMCSATINVVVRFAHLSSLLLYDM
jgi:fructosamine-3-kinase